IFPKREFSPALTLVMRNKGG
ncbi:hypothetical protein D047_4348B, partial [Vibrio parahaemolyticus VPTS-2010_2]